MALKRYDVLFPHVGPFVPVPLLLINDARALGIASNDLHVLLALVAKAYARTSWPTVPVTWRHLQHVTGRSKDAVRRALRALEAADIIHTSRGGGRHHTQVDLTPLLARLGILHDARSAYAFMQRQQRLQERHQLALPLETDQLRDDPVLTADVHARAAAAGCPLFCPRPAAPPDDAATDAAGAADAAPAPPAADAAGVPLFILQAARAKGVDHGHDDTRLPAVAQG